MQTVPALTTSRLPRNLADFRNLHSAETLIVCGCGASLKEFKNPENFITIGVNDVGRLFDPTYLVVLNPRQQFKDDRFHYVEQSRAQAIFTQLNLGIKHPNIIRFKLGKQGGTDLSDPHRLPYTRNSPYVALCLALHMGAKRIGLIGVDFTEHHFFAETGRHSLTNQLAQIDKEYAALANCCRSLGVEVVNLSEHSRLTAFPKARPADFAADVTTGSSDASGAMEANAAEDAKVFFVNYRFLSCGEVFSDALRNASRSLGVATADAYWDDPQLPAKVSAFRPDLLFVVHGRRFVQRWSRTFAAYNSAVWLLDEPYEVDDTEKWSHRFQTVFVNDPATLDRHRNAHYLPVAYDAEVHWPGNLERNYDVGFVGGYNTIREQWLLQLLDAGLLSYVVGGPWRAARLKRLCLALNIPASETTSLYQRTKIVVNVFRERHHFNRQRIPAQSLNPRVYEALACGALIVSEQRPELNAVFPGLPAFTTGDEMVARIGALIEDAGERERLLACCRHRLSEHTYASRLQSALEISLSKSHRLNIREKKMSTIVVSEPAAVATTPKLPTHWLDCGAIVTAAENGEWVIARWHNDMPGSEQGLASEQSFGDVELAFEVLLSNDAVFLAKIHQAEQFNQASNSYHLYCRPGQAFVAMHNRILANVTIARNRWASLVLGWQGGLLTLSRDGVQVAAVHELSLPAGYCFLGVKGGQALLRNVKLRPLNEPPHRHGGLGASQAVADAALPAYEVLGEFERKASPTVSIVTTVYDRISCLQDCIRSVKQLRFRDIEHIIVSDHPSNVVVDSILQLLKAESVDGGIIYANLKRRFNNWGIAPATVGLHLARGRYVCFLSDDNGYTPQHLDPLVAALEQDQGIGFAYSSCLYAGRRPLRHPVPRPGAIDLGQPLFRRELFERYLPGALAFDMMAWDWHMIKAFMDHGVRWRHIDQTSFLFRLRSIQKSR